LLIRSHEPDNLCTFVSAPQYVLKDLDYVLALATDVKVQPRVAELARRYYDAARQSGLSGRYFPGVIELVENGGLSDDGRSAR
jgi:3-hydroxyisobutyrate dehydrogenase-like beta-hydroxyacid dehydrogenase